MSTTGRYLMKKRYIPLDDSWDVIVVGGGPAGCAAAAASARQGARTLLVERTAALGGMGTLGLVPWFCGYSDGEKIIARGIAERVRTALINGMPLLKKWVETNPLHAPAIDPELLKRIYDEIVTESGAKILFQTQMVSLELSGKDKVDTIILANKSGLSSYRAKIYIDTTGDGDLAAWAGASFEKGDVDGTLQPATQCFIITNVDEYRLNAGPSVHFYDPESPIYKAVKSKKYPLISDLHSCYIQIGPRTYGFNTGHIFNVDNTDPHSISDALIYGRKQAAQYQAALAEYHPAFACSFLTSTGTLMGTRETRRIIGDYILTIDDYLARRKFPDEICRNAYNIDVHSKKHSPLVIKDKRKVIENIKKNIHREIRGLGKGENYGVPYRSLTPKGLKNVLVAGRCISTDREVNGSVRIMSCCLTTGEAAGVAGSMAAAGSRDVHKVDTDRLRKILKKYGAYLPNS